MDQCAGADGGPVGGHRRGFGRGGGADQRDDARAGHRAGGCPDRHGGGAGLAGGGAGPGAFVAGAGRASGAPADQRRAGAVHVAGVGRGACGCRLSGRAGDVAHRARRHAPRRAPCLAGAARPDPIRHPPARDDAALGTDRRGPCRGGRPNGRAGGCGGCSGCRSGAGGRAMITGFFDSIPAMIVLTGVLVGISAAILGSFLVLRGNAMLSDAISHSIVFGIVVVWLLTGQASGPVQVLGAALTGVMTVVLSELLARSRLVRMDAAIGLVFPALFAAGVILISVHARDVHIDVDTVLLGEIGFVWLHTVSIFGQRVPVAVATLGVVLVVNLAFVLLLWKELKLATFDPGLAAALGFLPGVLHYAILTLTSVTAVAAFDAVGAILFIAFVIVPPATAYLLTRRLWLMVALAVALSVAACVSGYALAV